MNWNEAKEYCENHDCIECKIHTENLDKRTDEQKWNHTPCFVNLVGSQPD